MISKNKNGIINVSGKDTEEMIRKAEGSQSVKIKIRSKTERIVFSFAESAGKIALSGFQKVARTGKDICAILDDKIEDRIGEEADIPDFVEAYPIQDIIAMALACPASVKTIMATKDYFPGISKRQAIRIRHEIDNAFPSFPAYSRIWEVMRGE
jgi:hypothetical protein